MFSSNQTIWHGRYASGRFRRSSTCAEGLLNHSNQATLEIEFMHQTLGKHVTSNATEKLSSLYNKISQAYHRRPGDENFQVNLDGVKRTLAETRRSTQREFLCFKQSKSSSNRSNTPGSSRSGHEKDGSRSRKDHR